MSDHAIFNAHSRKWEKEYLYDMELLNVKEPDVMTRVRQRSHASRSTWCVCACARARVCVCVCVVWAGSFVC